MAIWQDLVSYHGFVGGYQTVKRFVRKLRGLSPCSISSRYGSQALADCCGWSVGGPWFPENDAPESVVTWYSLAGFEGSGSVVTPLAGFAGARRPQAPGGRTAIPAAFR